MTCTDRYHHTSELLWGGVLLLIGFGILLDNLGFLDLGTLWRHWPILIVIVGIGKLVAAENMRERGGAFWWIFIGAWLYVSVLKLFGLGFHDTWPMLLVAFGLSMILKSLYQGPVEKKELRHG